MSSPSLHTILGSTGNIGTQLAKELKMYTDHIRLVSRNPNKINESDQIMKADLLLENQVDAAVAGSDTVYLVAGITYRTKLWQEQWPIIMKNTIQACMKHNAKLVFFDNMYCYDPMHVGHLTETTRFCDLCLEPLLVSHLPVGIFGWLLLVGVTPIVV
ncbi:MULTISPECIES: NAD(P)H-binding protein [Rhodonellum]|nr:MULTISPECIES: NAD(P)H-binding protein [Rhodonellum]